MITEDVNVLSDPWHQPLGRGNKISLSKYFSIRDQEHLGVLGKWKDITKSFLLTDFAFCKKKL